MMNRRNFLESTAAAGLGGVAMSLTEFGALATDFIDPSSNPADPAEATPFDISISQWSFHRAIFGDARNDYEWFIRMLHENPDAVLRGEMDPRDIVVRARELNVDKVDLVNILFFGHPTDDAWLSEFNRRASGEGVGFEVLMLDEAGSLGASEPAVRLKAVEQHRVWMDCARTLGCPSIRVNAYGDGTYLEQLNQAAESLNKLGDLGAALGLDVLVENHGHPSSNGAWLAMLMEKTNHPRVGVLADFDNFFMGGWGLVPERRYDTLQGMLDLAPYTRALSAKSYSFLPNGDESRVDFEQCLRAALDAGFRGIASAEYEGETLSEFDGSRATVALLRRLQVSLSDDYPPTQERDR